MERQIAALATDAGQRVMWDIDALLSDLSEVPPVQIPTPRLMPGEWLTIDREYAKTTDVSKPILVFELFDRKAYIADGNHRLYRAVAENIPYMNVIFVPERMHLRYLFRCAERDYCETIRGLFAENIFIESPF